MSFRKLVLKSTTMMSLNERFTWLSNMRENNMLQHQASAKNRRLSQQMERRPAVMAALKLKKKSLRQRLGQPVTSNVKDRLTLTVPARGGRGRQQLRGRGRPGGGRGGRGGGRLSRSQSMQSLNRSGSGNDTFRYRQGQLRAFSPRRPFRRSGRGNRGGRNLRGGVSRGGGGGGGGMGGGRGLSNNKFSRSGSRGRGNSYRRGVGISRGAGRMRGGRGGRGSMRGRQNQNIPSKEELDLQLDQYMASTKSHLDRELDSYMNQAQDESWD